MRTCLIVAMAILFLAKPGFGEDIKPEQIKRMYDDALAQLKAAQDRKAELSRENEVLNAKLAEMQKQLAESQDQVTLLKRQVASHDDKTFTLRAYLAAWEMFLRHHPVLQAQWDAYVGHSVLNWPADLPDLLNLDWQPDLTEMDSISAANEPQQASWKEERGAAPDPVGPTN